MVTMYVEREDAFDTSSVRKYRSPCFCRYGFIKSPQLSDNVIFIHISMAGGPHEFDAIEVGTPVKFMLTPSTNGGMRATKVVRQGATVDQKVEQADKGLAATRVQ